ncbi:MAG: DUF1501 domain-containing protein [Actinomycetota bacterium]
MSSLSRRRFLAGSGLATAGAISLAGARFAFAAPGTPNTGDVLVVLNLGGGVDSLIMTPPYDYPSYHQMRPLTKVLPPGENGGALPLTSATANGNALFPTGIEGVVGLHPAMAPVYETLWPTGNLAIVPSIGIPRSEDPTRSHFSARRVLERGTADNTVGGGWMGRALNLANPPGLVGGFNFSKQSLALSSGDRIISGQNAADFGFEDFDGLVSPAATIGSLFSGADSVSTEGRLALDVTTSLSQLDFSLRPGYPDTEMGRSLSQIATMLKADVGLHAAIMETGNWDHHDALGETGDTEGPFWSLASDMAQAMRAFADDTNQLEEITLVTVCEFGRTIEEKSNTGSDHGRATAFMAMGQGIQGGVFGNDFPDTIEHAGWGGDLEVLTDFRTMLSEILRKRMGVSNLDVVFPTYDGAPELGLAR